MDAIRKTLEDMTQFYMTEAICVAVVAGSLIGLVALSLVVEACDAVPDRKKNRIGGAKKSILPVSFF